MGGEGGVCVCVKLYIIFQHDFAEEFKNLVKYKSEDNFVELSE